MSTLFDFKIKTKTTYVLKTFIKCRLFNFIILSKMIKLKPL